MRSAPHDGSALAVSSNLLLSPIVASSSPGRSDLLGLLRKHPVFVPPGVVGSSSALLVTAL